MDSAEELARLILTLSWTDAVGFERLLEALVLCGYQEMLAEGWTLPEVRVSLDRLVARLLALQARLTN